jgi:hypothetical protein
MVGAAGEWQRIPVAGSSEISRNALIKLLDLGYYAGNYRDGPSYTEHCFSQKTATCTHSPLSPRLALSWQDVTTNGL